MLVYGELKFPLSVIGKINSEYSDSSYYDTDKSSAPEQYYSAWSNRKPVEANVLKILCQ
jgi:hypothetical protein